MGLGESVALHRVAAADSPVALLRPMGGRAAGFATLVLCALLAGASGCGAGEPEPAAESTRAPEMDPLELEALEAIGYVAESESSAVETGVIRHDPTRTQDGLNFYVSAHGPEALLVDMEGRVLHRWRYAYDEAFSDITRNPVRKRDRHHWRRAYLQPDGSVLAIFEGEALIRVDARSKLVWGAKIAAHHAAQTTPDGEIYVLVRDFHIVPRVNPRAKVFEDFVAVVDLETGALKRRTSVLAAMENSAHRRFVEALSPTVRGDLFHTNSLEILDGRLAARHPAFQAGNLLLSARALDAIFVLDPRVGSVVWARTGSFRKQHDPRALESGGILLFDNKGIPEGSRVLELSVESDRERVVYAGSPPSSFRSNCCGTAAPLANGNLLITESTRGRALEVTPGGEVVWEFVNPNVTGEAETKIANLFDLMRIPKAAVDWRTGSP